MLKKRVIPCLLLKEDALVKTIQFKSPTYIGDPLNAVKIYNDCAVDELLILDIMASLEKRGPRFDLISRVVDECFVPLAYGGGVSTIDEMNRIFQAGVEKICVNTLIFENPEVVQQAVDRFGAQSIVASLDFKRNVFGNYEAYTQSGKCKVKKNFDEIAAHINHLGVGELVINDIQRDGMMEGYNIELLKKCMGKFKQPLIGLGGAGTLAHVSEAFQTGIQALAAGSLFVYKSSFRGVLINYPDDKIEAMR